MPSRLVLGYFGPKSPKFGVFDAKLTLSDRAIQGNPFYSNLCIINALQSCTMYSNELHDVVDKDGPRNFVSGPVSEKTGSHLALTT